jgi:hypothetical protein
MFWVIYENCLRWAYWINLPFVTEQNPFTDVCCILLLRTSSPRCMLYITSAYFFAKMYVVYPRKRKLLSIPQTDKIHPLQNQMRLIACRLSGEITKVKEFREMQPISYLHLGEEVRPFVTEQNPFTDVCCILLLRTSSPRCMLYITSAYFFAKMYVVYYFCVLLRQDVCCILSTIRRNYESEGISRNATNIILASWRGSTQK